MRVIANSGLEYIPDWNANRKQSKESKLKIEYKYLSGPERDKIIGFEPVTFNPDGDQIGGFTFRIDNEGLLRASIINIANLEIEINGEYKQVNVEDICDRPELAGLYRELVDFFMGINRPVDKKKFK